MTTELLHSKINSLASLVYFGKIHSCAEQNVAGGYLKALRLSLNLKIVYQLQQQPLFSARTHLSRDGDAHHHKKSVSSAIEAVTS